ncbi:alpha/beta fold hydrolase [Rhizobium sp. L1K21]|uniref:alpha/beta fold hydrolase n=1 Tax=Rhizobium sp. L1K21 TaxID=2954933 RepID=UPI00209222F7|nr:alpha/beta hydrolase [Rhizobium sp. L1K21]MCO6186615.1 alpha/beta hydrolase [Rhizobium sp. L1K21]
MTVSFSEGFKEHYYTSEDGLKLYAREYGADVSSDALPIVCLPGLTRNSGDFHLFALKVAHHPTRPRKVFTFDLRGRGKSAWDDHKENYNPVMEAKDVVTGCQALGIKKAVFIGTSRGGLVMHIIMTFAPDLMAAAVLNDVGPALAREGLELIQTYLKVPPAKVTSWDLAVQGAKFVHGTFFTAFNEQDWVDMAHASLVETPDGLKAPVDPAIAIEIAKADLSKPLIELWDQFELFKSIPLLTIRGETSLLLSEEIVEKMKARNPAMETIVVKGQGHAPFLHMAGLDESILDLADKAQA